MAIATTLGMEMETILAVETGLRISHLAGTATARRRNRFVAVAVVINGSTTLSIAAEPRIVTGQPQIGLGARPAVILSATDKPALDSRLDDRAVICRALVAVEQE
jgi:hypothetical protein